MASPPPEKSKQKGIGYHFKKKLRRFRDSFQASSLDAGHSPTPSASPGPSLSGTPAPPSPLPAPQSMLAPPAAPTTQNQPAPSLLGPESTCPPSVASAKPSIAHGIGQAAASGLASALQALKIGAQTFTPLAPVIDDLLSILDFVKASTKNQEEYDELTSRLTKMAETIHGYMGKLSSEDQKGSAARILGSIQGELEHIQQQQSRSRGKRILETNKDQDDVIKRYRQVEALFQQLQNDISLRILEKASKDQMASLLERLSAVDAAQYDSAYSATVRRRGCTPKTREQVQQDLYDWIKDPNSAKIYWMNGMAGTGKTTIAYSLCEWLEENQRLGGNFFCSRMSSSCRDVNVIVPTIAYQLSQYSPGFRSALCGVLESSPNDAKRNVVKQFERLLQAPIKKARDTIPDGAVIVIDALDECEDDYSVRLILGTLLKLGSSLPVKFFITSRPDSGILNKMLSPGGYPPEILHLHNIEQSIVEDDIKKYLIEAFEDMTPPPSHDEIEQLAKLAGKLFIFAATAVRYVLPGKGPGNPAGRLKTVLGVNYHEAQKKQPTQRYKHLDDLYKTVLETSFGGEGIEEDEIEVMRLVLWTVVCAKEPMSVSTLSTFLSRSEEEVSSALQPLLSVLHVSESNGLVSTLHASFPDYMLDQSRSGKFCCDEAGHNHFMADRCLDVMKDQLRFNICSLESSFVFDSDVADLQDRIEANISPSLFYACQHWGEHLSHGLDATTLGDKLAEFYSRWLLFWLEVLNLKQRVVEGVSLLSRAKTWLTSTQAPRHLQSQADDAHDFVSGFVASACGKSTPHIYISAIPFSPKSSFVYECYQKRMQGLLEVKGTAMEHRKYAALATWTTDSQVNSLAISQDGKLIVAGLSDKTIRVWDAQTGDVVAGPFQGHTESVNSVAFSLDGARIASGSNDGTVRVWDARTGDLVAGPFEGHTQSVFSVAFSPDSTRIVSGTGSGLLSDPSPRGTIQVWDVCTGDLVAGPFQGHASWVNSLAFSPDGTRIASGSGNIGDSSDNTIRVWDARTGDAVAGPFQGHTHSVNSVAFSPDGMRIVSGSSDNTILVWDARTGDIVAGPLRGHTDGVNSVAFSPDGTRIVSGSGSIFGSSDNTVRVWDAHTGFSVAGPFQGHTALVGSVAFSPDSTRIVSSSSDSTIRLWNARTGDVATRPFQGHTDLVSSAAFSPDGTCIVSGSFDHTVKVWDAHTGDLVAGPLEGHTHRVNSVAFSPDSTAIASGSSDKTIRVWGTRTGDVVAGPFEGHKASVNSVAFSPDGARIVSGSEDIIILVWDARTGDVVAGWFLGHKFPVNSVAFSPDGTRVVSGSGDPFGSSDNPIQVWDARTGDIAAGPFQGHEFWVYSVAFSPDGSRIVSGTSDSAIRVWDAGTGDVVVGPLKGHTDVVNSVAFSPDGTRIVSGSEDKTILVWDARTGDVVAGPLKGHTSWVKSVAFSPDGMRVVSGSGFTGLFSNAGSDNSVRVWDIRTGNVVAGPSQGQTDLVNSIEPGSRDPSIGASDYLGTLEHDNNGSSSLSLSRRISASNIETGLPLRPFGFEIRRDGWAMSGGFPLFWVPSDLRPYMPDPSCSLVISPLGALSIDYQPVMGKRWHECYVYM